MARPRRFRIANVSHHVIQRGNNRGDVFCRHEDFTRVLDVLQDAASRHGVDVHAYVLMTNHFHLLVTPRTPTGLERMMHSVGFRYAQYFNISYQRTGALFEGRYRSTIVDSDLYWYSCMRYVELNPVRAGMVTDPASYRWSSHKATAFGAPDPLIVHHPMYMELGSDAAARQRCWRHMCSEEMPADHLEQIRAAVHAGGALGPLIVPAEQLRTVQT